MSQHKTESGDLQAWLARWPVVRQELEALLEEHATRDPSLHFELALAQLELKDIDENVRRIQGMSTILLSNDLTTPEIAVTHGHGSSL